MIQPIRKKLYDGVFLTTVRSSKYKTGLLGAQFITPLDAADVSYGALLPAVLRRGTTRCPDMKALSCALDELYGASVSYTVRKKGENHCLGFLAGFIDDAFVPGGERLLEPVAELLGDLTLDPVTQGGRFLSAYTESEKSNLIDEIRAAMNDRREYAEMRLLQEMCGGERYGIDRLGTERAVSKINNRSLFSYYQTLLASAHLELFYCGSAEPARVEQALLHAFAALPREQIVPPAAAVRRDAPDEPRRVEETMDVAQSKLTIGFRAASEDMPAMLLANLIFGGYSNSKLFLNVREKLSLCYFASSMYHRAKGIVTVSSGIDRKNYDVACGEIMAQLSAVQDGRIEPWELEGAKSCMISSIRSREDSPARLEEFFLAQAATGISEPDELLIAALQEVTADRVAEAAKTIRPDTIYFLKGEEESADA